MALPYKGAKRPRLQKLAQTLWTERSTFDSHWRELGDFFKPRRLRFMITDRNRGDKRNQKIIDSSGLFAARTLQSGLHAGLTSPARPWFILSTPDPSLNRRPAVKAWLHEVTERMRSVYQKSNLYNSLPIVYGDMGTFATGAMALREDPKDLLRTYTYPIGSYAIGVNARGLVTTFYREFETTVRQVVEDFGLTVGYGSNIDWSHISARVQKHWDDGNYETPIEVCWLVLPNEDADASRLESKYLPWSSFYWEKGAQGIEAQQFLRESGFQTFPVLCPRWDVTSHEDAYGTDCPGMTALGDVKQLQSEQKKKAQALNKMLDPPLVGSSQLRTQKVSLLPADITYEDTMHGQEGLRSIHETRIDISHVTADIQDVRYVISRAFFEDLFLMLANDRRNARATAREIDERHEEKLLALGPVLERTNDELLEPLVDRTYEMMDTAGLIPESPEELQGIPLTVEYVSILAQAQKLIGVVAQDRFLNSVGALAQTFPNVRHKIVEFKAVDNYGEMLGADPLLIRTDEEAQALVDAEQQQIAQAQQAERLKTMAAAGKAASETNLDSNSALKQLMQAAGGAG